MEKIQNTIVNNVTKTFQTWKICEPTYKENTVTRKIDN